MSVLELFTRFSRPKTVRCQPATRVPLQLAARTIHLVVVAQSAGEWSFGRKNDRPFVPIVPACRWMLKQHYIGHKSYTWDFAKAIVESAYRVVPTNKTSVVLLIATLLLKIAIVN